MKAGKTMLFGTTMLAIGYLCGTGGVFDSPPLFAQPEERVGPGKEAEKRIQAANVALQDAMEQLRLDGRYTTVTDGLNSFLILTGGGNAQQDLDAGNGVDPETFAALFAGKANPEIAEQLGTDEEGRLTYNDKPITVYSRSRLERLYAERLRIKDGGL